MAISQESGFRQSDAAGMVMASLLAQCVGLRELKQVHITYQATRDSQRVMPVKLGQEASQEMTRSLSAMVARAQLRPEKFGLRSIVVEGFLLRPQHIKYLNLMASDAMQKRYFMRDIMVNYRKKNLVAGFTICW